MHQLDAISTRKDTEVEIEPLFRLFIVYTNKNLKKKQIIIKSLPDNFFYSF